MLAKKFNINSIVYASSSSVYSGLPSDVSVFNENQSLKRQIQCIQFQN